MLKAAGWRLFRLTVDKKKLKSKADPAGYVREQAKRKGLVLDSEGRNPMQPFRYREIRKGVYEIEQLQNVTGQFAGCPPEHPDYFERFMAGEAWGGVVKTGTI